MAPKFHLKTYRPEAHLPPHHFFIQSKGNHSGRPSTKPIRNSFLVTASSDADLAQVYNVTHALFICRQFEIRLIGSVIPFIRKRDVLELIETYLPDTADCRQTFLTGLAQAEALEKHLQDQLRKTHQLKQLLAQQYLIS